MITGRKIANGKSGTGLAQSNAPLIAARQTTASHNV